MPFPLTFHVQVRTDASVQAQAVALLDIFTRHEVTAALNVAQTVHFARLLAIPVDMDKKPGPGNVFALQMVIVYDGELSALNQLFWNTPSLRSLVQSIASLANVPPPALNEAAAFSQYITSHNLNPSPRELHKGYDLSVPQILKAFPEPSAVK